jgi:NADPH-dependent glutamate synthase beta subunit-like oxidoreductase
MKATSKASILVCIRCSLHSNSHSLIFAPLVRVEWTKDSSGRWKMEEVPSSEKFFPAQLVFLALGFLGPTAEVIKALDVKQDARSNIQTPNKVRVSH